MDKDQLIDSAARLHQALQEQLKIAIDRRLGPGAWTWDELEVRIQIVNRPEDGPGVDTYCLDREPLLRAHAIEAESQGRAVRFIRRIEHLMAGGDPQECSD